MKGARHYSLARRNNCPRLRWSHLLLPLACRMLMVTMRHIAIVALDWCPNPFNFRYCSSQKARRNEIFLYPRDDKVSSRSLERFISPISSLPRNGWATLFSVACLDELMEKV